MILSAIADGQWLSHLLSHESLAADHQKIVRGMAVQLVYTFLLGAHALDIDGCARSEQWFRTYTKMYNIVLKYRVVRWVLERI
jgi:hypothetical protein